MKETKKERTIWRSNYFSLSRLLRDTQTKEGLKITTPIFAALNLPTTGKIKPSEILESLSDSQFYTDKKGNKFPAYVTRREITDENGNPVLTKEGLKTYEYKLTPIREGSWTLDKLCKLISDRNALQK